MNRRFASKAVPAAWLAALAIAGCAAVPARAQQAGNVPPVTPPTPAAPLVTLPQPPAKGKVSLEQALRERRLIRNVSRAPVPLADLAQILWAGQGVVGEHGRRTVASAGGLYPLQLVVVAGAITGLPPAVYRYVPDTHALERSAEGDQRSTVANACQLSDNAKAPAFVLITGNQKRVADKLGERTPRIVAFEAGGVAQAMTVEATSLGLATGVAIGFTNPKLAATLGTTPDDEVLAILTIAKP